MVMVSAPVTVTVAVTSGMFVPLAWIVAVPGATPVTTMFTVVNELPSGKKFTLDCSVATAVLLDDKFTDRPSAGAAADKARGRMPVAFWAIVKVVCLKVTVAFTWTDCLALVKPVAEAVISAEPTFTPVICGWTVGVVAPCAMTTLEGDIETFFASLLDSDTVTPPAGAGLAKVIAKGATWARFSVGLVGSTIVPGFATVTLAVVSGMLAALARIMVLPIATPVTGTLTMVLFAVNVAV